MRTKRHKVFSYPYYSDFTDDYVSQSFELNADPGKKEGLIGIRLSYEIGNKEILSDIENGRLSVIARLTCSTMGYVVAVPFDPHKQSVVATLDANRVDEEIEATAYLMANEDFTVHYAGLAPEWNEIDSMVQKGNVIGESATCIVGVAHKRDGKKASIFSFVEDLNAKPGEPVKTFLTDKRIRFIMDHETKEAFEQIKNRSYDLVVSSLLVPVVAQILQKMKNLEVDAENDFNLDHRNKQWYKVIESKFVSHFKTEPTSFDCNEDPFVAAQALMGKPINNTFRYGVLSQNAQQGSLDDENY